jgi:hypothetical protein
MSTYLKSVTWSSQNIRELSASAYNPCVSISNVEGAVSELTVLRKMS